MEEMLRLPNIVTMESPVAPKGEGQKQQQLKDSVKKKNNSDWAPDLEVKLTFWQ